ncbi:hypothetical protein ACXZ1M_25845 [Duganella sp. PWIR1]
MSRKLLPILIGAALASLAEAAPVDTNAWPAINASDLKIVAGSPLDFSGLIPAGPAGINGRVIKNTNNRLAFANTPDTPAPFHCASLAWSPLSGSFPGGVTAETYAEQLKRHGYNLVRLHYVDATLMHQMNSDFGYNSTQQNNFYYLLNELKKRGIYWMIDMMTSENGSIGDTNSNRFIAHQNLKFRVQLEADVAAQNAWKGQVSAIYSTINPGTQQPTLSDPALAGVVLVNEGEISYLAQLRDENGNIPTVYRPELKPLFNAYLRTKFGADNDKLRAAWVTGDQIGILLPSEKLEDGNIEMPKVAELSLRMATFQEFLSTLEVKTTQWMKDYLRQSGYPGVVTSYNNWNRLTANAMRSAKLPGSNESALDMIDSHAYLSAVDGFKPGAQITQVSLADHATMVENPATNLAVTRQAGLPFGATEYGQVFWNKYRFEASAMVPAVAALQGWDFMCVHSEGAIDLQYEPAGPLRKQAINPYGIGLDPVARAGETLSALLFLRRDVAPSPNRVTISYPSPYRTPTQKKLESGNAVSDRLRVMALLTGVEIKYPVPGQSSNSQNLVFYDESSTDPADTITKLSNILGPDNVSGSYSDGSDASKSNYRYQSDTKQLLLDEKTKRFTIKTPRTEVVTTAVALSNLALNTFKIQSIDDAALLSASTLNINDTLATSKKILMIFATDAANTNMSVTVNGNKEILQSPGILPVRVRPGSATASLQLKHKTPMKLWALDLTGQHQREIQTTQIETDDGIEWQFTLNNAVTGFDPTTFFVLEEAPSN